MAPFETPVAPPEYWNKAVSSGAISIFGRADGSYLAIKSCIQRSPSGKGPSTRCPPFFSTASVKSRRVIGGNASLIFVTINVLIFVLGWAALIVLRSEERRVGKE